MGSKVLRYAALVLACALVLAPSAMAADPSNTKQTITSENFNTSNGGFVFSAVDLSYPSMAYWGRIATERRGTSGSSIWCAGTARYPAPAVSTFYPSYPTIGDFVTRSDEQIVITGTAKQLAYQGTSSIEVWSGANKTGTKYVKDTDYTLGANVAGYTTIVRKGVSIPNGATVFVTYKFKTAGTSGKASLSVPQLDGYYQSWLSFYYRMPSLGATDLLSLNWVASDNPGGPAESIYGPAFPVTSSWTYKERELSDGETVKLSRRAGTLSFQFVDNSPGAGGIAGGQGPAVDDVAVVGYKYGPARDLDASLVGEDITLSWTKPARTPLSATADERTIAYRVWRRAVGGAWSELTASDARLATTGFTDTDPLVGRTLEYAVQPWDPGTGTGYGQYLVVTQAGPPDHAAPQISVTGVADDNSYPGNVTPVFSATDNVAVTSFSATLDGVPFTSGTLVSGEGHHTLVISAGDAAGNSLLRQIDFVVDKTAPQITLEGVSDGQFYKTSKTPTFGATDALGLDSCTATLNGAAYVSGTPIATSGTYTLVVVAVDDAGNTSSQTRSFVIDTVSPAVTVSGVANGASYGSAVSPVFSATDNIGVASLGATLDGQPFLSGAQVGANGLHALVVTAVDHAGNVTTRTISFTVDTLSPVITVTGVENEASYAAPVNPAFSATHPSGSVAVAATLDAAPFVSGGPVAADGVHELVVTATSAAQTTVSRTTFTIDTIDPVITLSGVADGDVRNDVVTPVFGDSDNRGVTTRSATLNGVPFASGSPINADGTYTLALAAADAAGNSATRSVTFTIDTVDPVIELSGVEDGEVRNSPVTPVFSAEDETELESVGATLKKAPSPTGAPFTSNTPIGADGVYTLALTATDAAGNTAERAVTFTIDTIAPVITIPEIVDGRLYNTVQNPVFSVTEETEIESVVALLDGAPFVSGAAVGEGAHTLAITAHDVAGNSSARTVKFSVDTGLPIDSSPQFEYVNGKTNVKLAATDARSGVTQIRYRVDAKADVVKNATWCIADVTGVGSHRLEYQSFDKAGNSSVPKIITVRVKSVPSLAFSVPATSEYGSAKVSGTLKTSGGSGPGGKTVRIEYYSGGWKLAGTAKTASSGAYSLTVKPTIKTTYRAVFEGDATDYLRVESSSRAVEPKAYLQTPWTSKTVKAKKTYTWYSSIKPRHTSGSKVVKLEFQRYKSGKYRAYKTIYAKTYNYSDYSRVKASYKLPYKGKWRVRAVHDDAGHAPSTSAWLYKTAK